MFYKIFLDAIKLTLHNNIINNNVENFVRLDWHDLNQAIIEYTSNRVKIDDTYK